MHAIRSHRVLVAALGASLWLGAVGGAILIPDDAFAQDEAEKFRLMESMKSLAQKNAWTGVERVYGELLELKLPLPEDIHLLGAQSARTLGKTLQVYERLQRAHDVAPDNAETNQNIQAIEGTYGRVRIVGKERWSPVLARADMPFAPDERRSIEYAIEYLAGAGSFEGMLPLGTYTVGTQTFEVTANQDFAEIKLSGKDVAAGATPSGEPSGDTPPKGEEPGNGTKPPKAERPKPDGFIIYAGPVATAGFGFGMSGQPGEAILDEDYQETSPGRTVIQPIGFNASGVSAEIGGEIGLTYQFGIAATIGYSGGFGSRATYHNVNGWLAAAIRPGDLRIAVGPTWGYLTGTGQGLADWVEVGQNHSVATNEEIRYQGQAVAGGAALSVGYGLLDLDPLQGVVELGGGWKTDGQRSYMTAGLRIGIVPRVPHYDD